MFSVLHDDFDLARAGCSAPTICAYQGILASLVQTMDDVYPTIRSDDPELTADGATLFFARLSELYQTTRACQE